MSVLLGDLAITAALGAPIESRARSLEAIGEAIQRMADGEMIEAEDRYASGRTIEHCMRSLECRAGSSLALAARLGAIAAGAEDPDGMARYGNDLGIADQLGEDIRDLTVGDELTRRRPGSDLREGTYTLPVIYALEADPALRAQLDGPVSGPAAAAAVARIRESGALDQAGAECRRYAMRAQATAAELGSPAGAPLSVLAELPIRRLDGVLGEHAGTLASAVD
jgi:heptaprenyl diphosphate synthase